MFLRKFLLPMSSATLLLHHYPQHYLVAPIPLVTLLLPMHVHLRGQWHLR